MGKRFIERPTARQIVDKAEREARYERAKNVNADWLAANFAPVASPAPAVSKADMKAAAEYATFNRFYDEWDTNDIPDKLGKTGEHEPKSIYSPVPASRIRFERPAKRKAAERNERDCEIPDYRRKQTFTIEDASGRARGAIEINPYSKRIRIGGFGLTTKA
ncbi:hypothetical protein [Bradyrhizobium sp. USDA 241]|uniref:hypothetical protein n=1 Tax=Bradyrhizobium sp. USDA 241 TaxID=3377725 RepID=UPI003C732E0F